MKNTCTLSQGLFLALLLQLASVQNSNGQGTEGIGLTLSININGVSYDIIQGPCGFETATWGGGVPDDFCAPVVWAYDVTPDSLCCDSVPAGSLAGKIVLVRRGVCEFGQKALNVEKAGALAMLVVNSLNPDDCAINPMGAGSFGAQVTIPVLMISGAASFPMDVALAAGQAVEVCYLVPQVQNPYAAYHYATPVSQVTALKNMGFRFFNREDTIIHDLVIKADIHEPSGNVASIESLAPPIAPGTDTLLFLPAYTPPAVTGTFEVVYSNNKYTEPRDTLRRKFVQTEYTWAMDNLTLQLDGGVNLGDFAMPKYQVGSLIFTGNNSGVAKYATFGIANADTIYNPNNPLGNQIAVIFYDADSDGNGDLNLTGSFEDDLGGDALGLTTYQMTGLEKEDELIDVPLLSFLNPTATGVLLEPNHPYYITVLYDGEENGSGHVCSFSNTAYEDYLFFRNEAQEFVPSTPTLISSTFSYWGDRTVVIRLHLDIPVFDANQPHMLSATQYSVTPNPANDHLRLNLDLAEQNSHVRVSIMSGLGRTLRSQSFKEFQSGQLDFDVRDIPSGTYLMWVQTVEGQAVTKVTICH